MSPSIQNFFSSEDVQLQDAQFVQVVFEYYKQK